MAENLNITDELKNKGGRALLVSVSTTDCADECMRSLDELARLLETAGGTEPARVVQDRVSPDLGRFERERTGGVHRAANHLGALILLSWDGFTGDHRLIDER